MTSLYLWISFITSIIIVCKMSKKPLQSFLQSYEQNQLLQISNLQQNIQQLQSHLLELTTQNSTLKSNFNETTFIANITCKYHKLHIQHKQKLDHQLQLHKTQLLHTIKQNLINHAIKTIDFNLYTQQALENIRNTSTPIQQLPH